MFTQNSDSSENNVICKNMEYLDRKCDFIQFFRRTLLIHIPNKIKLNADLDLFRFLNSMFFLFFTLPLKCYGYFPPLLSPLSVEVIFYPQESHYLASPSLLSSSLQLSWLSAILLCHSNLFLWHQYFVLTSGLCICVSACKSRLWNLLSWLKV